MTPLSNTSVNITEQMSNCNNQNPDYDSEQRIFEAAQTLFLQKGLSETTMQEIADQAGISRTSLHYYFRNKDKLFANIFEHALNNLLPQINETIKKDIPLVDKIIEITHNYIDLLHDNDQLPGFMVIEIRRNPKALIDFVLARSQQIDFSAIKKQMNDEVADGIIRSFDISQMVVTIVGLCVFPFVCKPLLSNVFEALADPAFDSFVADRKQVIAEMITHWLVINPDNEKK